MRNFQTWDLNQIELTFGVIENPNIPLLKEWMAATGERPYSPLRLARIGKRKKGAKFDGENIKNSSLQAKIKI